MTTSTEMTLSFAGFWQCRMSTDPDPTREPRGTSGYTFALAHERDFDRVIKTQRDQIDDREFRQPFPPYLPGSAFGVFVTEVEGAPTAAVEAALRGAQLRLLDRPCFELRNQIVGDGINRIAPPIVPINLAITAGADGPVYLRRSDPLDPERPDAPIWKLRPDDFVDRVPRVYRHLSDEVVETIFPEAGTRANTDELFNAYFTLRREWLQSRITSRDLAPGSLEAEAYATRIWAIQTHSGSAASLGLIENRLGLQCIWDHELRGPDPEVAGIFDGRVDRRTPWRLRFWMGGWDGDLMVGYMTGRLGVPLLASCSSGQG